VGPAFVGFEARFPLAIGTPVIALYDSKLVIDQKMTAARRSLGNLYRV